MVGRMSPRARIATFALVLVGAFVAAFALGSAFDPADTDAGGTHGMVAHEEAGMQARAHGGHSAEAATAAGLAVAEGGYALRLSPTRMQPGVMGELSFRIVDDEGEAVHDFDLLHEREMHLIVVRRDGAHFQHLHPDLGADGTWRVALTLPAAGVYRVFADFSVAGEQHTLATDLFAPGPFRPRPFSASAPDGVSAATEVSVSPGMREELPSDPRRPMVDRVGAYEVRLRTDSLEAAAPSALRFEVSERGEPVAPEAYLGANGHLVALREGDLAFLHVHPDEEGTAPSVIPYSATFPTAGRYRLYLQFKHGGRVRTAPFTVAVAR